MLSDYLHHLGILRSGFIHIKMEILGAITLQLLNHATGDELQFGLGGGEVEIITAV